MSGSGRFFIPGPTEVNPDVLAAQTRPMIGHRGEGMRQLMGRLQPPLRALFRTSRPVYIATCSATGLMEAALRNGAVSRVLSLVDGAFSERFAEIGEAVGLDVTRISVPWGEANQPEQLETALEHGDYDTVTVVHSETSTGVLNPVDELAAIAHAYGCLVLTDAVTSLAGSPVETDAWQLDFVLTGSQKALALPPGLALGVAQQGLLERAASSTRRGFYFDLLDYERNLESGQTPSTPALSLLYALEQQLDRIQAEGVEARWQRHAEMAQTVWSWVDALRADGYAINILAPEGFRSHTVSCVRMPHGRGAVDLVATMRERGFAIAPGYGAEKDRMFRIGHMGDHSVDTVRELLEALTTALAELRS